MVLQSLVRTQHEVLSRIIAKFRRVVIDWTEGDRWVEARIRALTDLDAHDVVLEAERALRGQTVLVSLAADPLCPAAAIGSDAHVFAGGTTELADLLHRWGDLGLDGFRLRPAVFLASRQA